MLLRLRGDDLIPGQSSDAHGEDTDSDAEDGLVDTGDRNNNNSKSASQSAAKRYVSKLY